MRVCFAGGRGNNHRLTTIMQCDLVHWSLPYPCSVCTRQVQVHAHVRMLPESQEKAWKREHRVAASDSDNNVTA